MPGDVDDRNIRVNLTGNTCDAPTVWKFVKPNIGYHSCYFGVRGPQNLYRLPASGYRHDDEPPVGEGSLVIQKEQRFIFGKQYCRRLHVRLLAR